MSITPFNLFCPYQIAWMNDPAGMAFAEKSRRIGFTYADAFKETIDRVGSTPAINFDAWYSATDMSAAEEYVGYCADFAKMVGAVGKVMDGELEVSNEKDEAVKISVMRIVFESGLKITAGSSNPNFFRSKGGSVRLDELAFHRDGRAMFKAAHASARFWGFPLRAWSSHHGPGSYFNGLIKQVRAGKLKASLHRVTILDAVEQGIVERVRMRKERLAEIPAVDLGYRREWLETLRAECPDEDVWNEEFMCVPSTDAGSFLDYELLRGCEVNNLSMWQLPTSATPWPTDRQLFVGVDVALRRDLTVITVLEKVGDVFWTRLIHVMHKAKWSEQEAVIDRIMGQSSVRRLCLDKTGIGEVPAERLKDKWHHRFEGVHFTGPVKIDLAMPLRRLFEDKKIRIPDDDELREDLHSLRKYVTASGNTRFEVDESDTDGHGDRFWSLTLSYHAADDNKLPVPPPRRRKPVGW